MRQQRIGFWWLHAGALVIAMSAGASMAIEPVFEGPDGIMAQVFTPSCLGCHGSAVEGLARRAAPRNLNWDVYEVARINGSRILEAAAVQRYMPPAASGMPVLDERQRAALWAWADAGYPQTSVLFAPGASFNFLSTQLYLPTVTVNGQYFEARLRMQVMPGTELGLGFELLSTLPVEDTDIVEAPAVFTPATGLVSVPAVTLRNESAAQQERRVRIVLRLLPGRAPWLFELVSLEYLPAE